MLSFPQQPIFSPHHWSTPLAMLLGADFISLSNFFNVVCEYNIQYFSSDLHNNSAISYMQVHFSKLDF